MRNFIYLFGIIPIYLMFSCTRTASTYTNKESVRIDTFFRYKEVVRTIPQKDSIIIFNPCDSTGIINKFYAQISIPNGKVNIQGKNNHIIATVMANEAVSVLSDSTNISKTSKSDSVSKKIIVKNIIPSWIIIALFIESTIILLYLYSKITFPR